jgi:hypothetical protein
MIVSKVWCGHDPEIAEAKLLNRSIKENPE